MSKYSRDKGLRFERRIARLFRANGYDCRRILEYDGFSRGCDLALYRNGAYLPIAIQCKNTVNEGDGARGLQEALDGYPNAVYHICIQNFNRKIRCIVNGFLRILTFDDLIAFLDEFEPN
jgi:hypothetical protein